MLLRPGGVMQFDDPENPAIWENFITALGADAVVYAFRNECCGGLLIKDCGATLAHIDKFAGELSAAGLVSDKVSPMLLPTYTHGREIR